MILPGTGFERVEKAEACTPSEPTARLVLVDPATMDQRRGFKRADRSRLLADDRKLLVMLPPQLAKDYQLLIDQLESETAAAPRVEADVPMALLTSTQVTADPFAGFSRGTHQYLATGHNIHARTRRPWRMRSRYRDGNESLGSPPFS